MTKYVGPSSAALSFNSVVIGQVRDISGPGMVEDSVDVTTRENSDRVYIPGLRDGGELTFDVIYDPNLATHITLQSFLLAGSVGVAELQLADTANLYEGFRFLAMVSTMTPESPLEGALGASITLRSVSQPVPIIYLVDDLGNYLVDESGNYLIS
jgi:hypothetical protein